MPGVAALYVVKLGSAGLRHDEIFAELHELHRGGARLLVVAGGAAGIAEHYRRIGRPVRTVTGSTGNTIRYCPADEIPYLLGAYEQVVLPLVEKQFARLGMSVFATTAHRGALVRASVNAPLRVTENGRTRVLRDHRAGTVREVDSARITGLLELFDVVCLTPPVADLDGGTALNVDADVLAAEVATALSADHLRLVTGTAGLLADPLVPTSTVRHVTAGEGQRYATGRMLQKVRAGEIALTGTCDVAITGPNTLSPATWFWRAPAPAPDLALLARCVELSSVSRDEREIAGFLAGWCAERGIPAQLDAAGNLVATKGSGPRRLLMLCHLDTLPHRWPVGWDGDVLTGRGSVDAKASLVACLSALAAVDVPSHVQVRLVGAVQQETTAAGALFARQHYPADAVIVGEPGGADAVTIGCHGLVQVQLSVVDATGHTAARTAGDRTAEAIQALRAEVAQLNQDATVAILGMHAIHGGDVQTGQAVVNVRVPQRLAVADLLAALENATVAPVHLKVLRATPAVSTPRASPLVSAFEGAFRAAGTEPCFLAKKGGSHMSTMVTTGRRVPIVAYGPGDPTLDHTPHEHIDAAEFRRARTVLTMAVRRWIAVQPSGVSVVPAAGTARTDR